MLGASPPQVTKGKWSVPRPQIVLCRLSKRANTEREAIRTNYVVVADRNATDKEKYGGSKTKAHHNLESPILLYCNGKASDVALCNIVSIPHVNKTIPA